MNQKDLEKLKILANNNEDFIDAVLLKIKNKAKVFNHRILTFHKDTHYRDIPAKGDYRLYKSYCKKCYEEIIVEFFESASNSRVYTSLGSGIEKPCK